MKNTIKLISVIALVAVIGFSMSACDDSGGDGGTVTIIVTNLNSDTTYGIGVKNRGIFSGKRNPSNGTITVSFTEADLNSPNDGNPYMGDPNYKHWGQSSKITVFIYDDNNVIDYANSLQTKERYEMKTTTYTLDFSISTDFEPYTHLSNF